MLWEWKAALKECLAELRQIIHDHKAQVTPTASGIPWLGFVVHPGFRKVKVRKVRYATRRLGHRYSAYCTGRISFAEFDASVQGWINHVRSADSWELRRHVLAPFLLKPGDIRKKLRGTTECENKTSL